MKYDMDRSTGRGFNAISLRAQPANQPASPPPAQTHPVYHKKTLFLQIRVGLERVPTNEEQWVCVDRTICVDLTLWQRLRRCHNVKSTQGKRLMFAGAGSPPPPTPLLGDNPSYIATTPLDFPADDWDLLLEFTPNTLWCGPQKLELFATCMAGPAAPQARGLNETEGFPRPPGLAYWWRCQHGGRGNMAAVGLAVNTSVRRHTSLWRQRPYATINRGNPYITKYHRVRDVK